MSIDSHLCISGIFLWPHWLLSSHSVLISIVWSFICICAAWERFRTVKQSGFLSSDHFCEVLTASLNRKEKWWCCSDRMMTSHRQPSFNTVLIHVVPFQPILRLLPRHIRAAVLRLVTVCLYHWWHSCWSVYCIYHNSKLLIPDILLWFTFMVIVPPDTSGSAPPVIPVISRFSFQSHGISQGFL